jgi:hypothetical protein
LGGHQHRGLSWRGTVCVGTERIAGLQTCGNCGSDQGVEEGFQSAEGLLVEEVREDGVKDEVWWDRPLSVDWWGELRTAFQVHAVCVREEDPEGEGDPLGYFAVAGITWRLWLLRIGASGLIYWD